MRLPPVKQPRGRAEEEREPAAGPPGPVADETERRLDPLRIHELSLDFNPNEPAVRGNDFSPHPREALLEKQLQEHEHEEQRQQRSPKLHSEAARVIELLVFRARVNERDAVRLREVGDLIVRQFLEIGFAARSVHDESASALRPAR
jgi:hypothetical protein